MLIPYTPNYGQLVSGDRRRFHEEETKKKRGGLLSELRLITGLPDVIKTFNQDVLYKVVVPKGELLQFNEKTGMFTGVLRKDGRISKHAQFGKVSPSLMSAAKAVGSQVLLVSIAMQLNEIQRSVDGLALGMHRDRIAEIEAGESLFRGAVLSPDEMNRKLGINHAIQSLHMGLKKTIAELRAAIANAPNPTNSIFDHINPLNDKLKKADRIMGLASESFLATMRGLGVLSECYAALSETEASRSVLTDFLNEIGDCDIQLAAQKARLTEFKGSMAPQLPWERFVDTAPALRRQLAEMPSEANWSSTTLEIEFMPHEILGATP